MIFKKCFNNNPNDNQNMLRSSSPSSASWLTNRVLVWLMWLSQVDNYGDDYVIMMMVVVIVVTSSRLSGWTLGLSDICLRGWIPKQSIYVDITALPYFFAFFKSTQSYSDRYDCFEPQKNCIFFVNPKHSLVDNINLSVQNFIPD